MHNCFILEPQTNLIRHHSLSFVVPLVVIRFTTCCHSLSLVAIRCHSLTLIVIRCHSLSFLVPLVVSRCTTHCHSLSLAVIHCHSLHHSLSLDIPLGCLFINDLSFMEIEFFIFVVAALYYFNFLYIYLMIYINTNELKNLQSPST